ncbi:MAG: phosphatidylserine decarboxylase family protein [bacterium]|nr:phosphatidylserine decarboxylase family protein [bacterium]
MIAREGWTFIIVGVVLTVLLIWAATRWDHWPTFALSLLLGILTIFTAFFFRDPGREIPLIANGLVAPADGKIVAIDTLDTHPHVGGPTLKVSIFLSVFDVHINRVPIGGTIDYVKYSPGKFLAAFNDKASLLNEQTEIGMTTEAGHKVVFKQIAGLIARRIVCTLKEKDKVATGDRCGMIRFGSRTDLLVPVDSRLNVGLGDRVKGGTTVMGYLIGPAGGTDESSKEETGDARL